MIPEHVMSWAKKPGPARLLAEIRSRRERGALGPRSLIKLEFTDGERREIGQMLSVRWQLSAQPLRLGELQSGLAGHGVDLDELLEACGGPLRNLRDERAAELLSKQADQSAARAILREAEPSVPDEVVTRCLVGATEWTPRAREIVRVLDATGESAERLPVLAARLFGDAHALDRSRPLGRAVARFVSGVVGVGESGGGDPGGGERGAAEPDDGELGEAEPGYGEPGQGNRTTENRSRGRTRSATRRCGGRPGPPGASPAMRSPPRCWCSICHWWARVPPCNSPPSKPNRSG